MWLLYIMTKRYENMRIRVKSIFRKMTVALNRFIVVMPFTLAGSAYSGSGIYELEWDNPIETLEYHSCGSGDTCWVADLKARQSGELIVRLRCDGEKMYIKRGSKLTEDEFQQSCAGYEETTLNSKSNTISNTFKLILKEERK